MADKLVETDVEKAGFKGGNGGALRRVSSLKRANEKAMRGNKGPGGASESQIKRQRRLITAQRYLSDRKEGARSVTPYTWAPGANNTVRRRSVRKSSDPIETLYAEIEKAGIAPRGGSSTAAKRMLGGRFARIYGRGLMRMGGLGGRADKLLDREMRRQSAGWRLEDRAKRIKKSADPVETLYAEIEKARGMLPVEKAGTKYGPGRTRFGQKNLNPSKTMRRHSFRMSNEQHAHAQSMYDKFGEKGVRQYLRNRPELRGKRK